MVKRVSTLVLVLCLMMNVNALAFMPMSDTIVKCTPRLSVSGNTADCSLWVRAQESSAQITAIVTLLKSDGEGGFTVLYRWAGLSGTGTLDFSDSYASSKITSGATYRMEFSVRVVGSNTTEDLSHYVEVIK